MEIDLKQGFAEIADRAPSPHLDPDALWRDGVRRRNRRRAASAGAVVAVMALVAGVVGVATTPGALDGDPPPAADPGEQGGPGHLPDTLWPASPWTPGTDRAGAPGRIALLFWDNVQRKSFWGSSGGYVTVSAVDGEYRYLDAPGLDDGDGQGAVLSPDGRFVAYPVTEGTTDFVSAVAREWRVYDAETGRVLRHRLADVPQGASASEPAVWSRDSRTLLLDVCRVTRATTDEQACRGTRTDAWDVLTGDTRELPYDTAAQVVGGEGSRLLLRSRGGFRELDLDSGRSRDLGQVPVQPNRAVLAATQISDGLVLVTGPGNTNEGRITLGYVPLRGDRLTGTPRTLSEFQGDTAEVAGQLRDGRLVTVGSAPAAVVVHDVAGGRTPLVRTSGDYGGSWPQVALDLALRPTVAAPRPDAPTDPRVLAAGAAAMVALLAVLGWAVRRRRPRTVGA